MGDGVVAPLVLDLCNIMSYQLYVPATLPLGKELAVPIE